MTYEHLVEKMQKEQAKFMPAIQQMEQAEGYQILFQHNDQITPAVPITKGGIIFLCIQGRIVSALSSLVKRSIQSRHINSTVNPIIARASQRR